MAVRSFYITKENQKLNGSLEIKLQIMKHKERLQELFHQLIVIETNKEHSGRVWIQWKWLHS